jgi:predicted nucleotidyltransferase
MDAAVEHSLEGIRSILLPLLEECGVEKAIVFGSRSRETHDRRSDLDLILVMKTSDRFLKRYDRIASIYRALPLLEIEVLVYTPEELARNSARPFFSKILEEGRVIYER